MKKIYIDFDGVILDTWQYFLDEYEKEYGNKDIDQKLLDPIINRTNWEDVILKSNEINNAINNIIELKSKYDVTIITKIQVESEIINKTKYLSNYEIKDIIFVDYNSSKSESVDPNNNILIDDTLDNLDEWSLKGGISIFFDKEGNNIDSFNKLNTKYKMITKLIDIEKFI